MMRETKSFSRTKQQLQLELEFAEFLYQQKIVNQRITIELGYWRETEDNNQIGLVIALDKSKSPKIDEIFRSIINSLKLNNNFQSDTLLHISFDDSIKLLQLCKQHYPDKEKFNYHMKSFIWDYFKLSSKFPLDAQVKPSVVAGLYSEPIDFLNKETFTKMVGSLSIPDALENALIKERGLMHYNYAYGSTRFHLFELNLNDVRSRLNEKEIIHFDNKYGKLHAAGIKGDTLKAHIISVIQKEISKCDQDAPDEIKVKWLEIKNRYDYQLLAQSQGISTKMLGIFGVKTSSIQALDKWMNFTYPDLMTPQVAAKAP